MNNNCRFNNISRHHKKVACCPATPSSIGSTGPTGPTGSVDPETELFTVNGTAGTATVLLGENMDFTSNDGTVTATVTQGSALVDLSAPGIGLQAYGGLYNNTAQVLNLIIGTPQKIAFNNGMPTDNTNVSTTNDSITIIENGVYEINYSIRGSASVGLAVTTAVRNNGVNIPSATTSRTLSVGLESVNFGSVIVNLVEGDVIDMAVSALIAATITLGGGTNATLSVKKIAEQLPN